MVVNKRKKNSRHRGSWTHGWGEKKKHRGAGSRGGRGMAGTGKRADTNKPSIQEDPKYFGKWGFVRPVAIERINAINVQTLASNLVSLGAEKKGTAYVVDLTKTQYNKLLGSGDIAVAVQVTVKYASASAAEKVKAAGGSVTTTAKVEETEKPAAKPAAKAAPAKK
ncbi:MAG TPA: uL15 family ribosomal protein [Acidobacteriota bacterium]|nr:uL15 family ribosomal protein [Acidobacteriota bacterium]